MGASLAQPSDRGLLRVRAQATLSNWANEFAKWAPPLRVVPYDGSPDERRALRAEHLDGAGGGNAPAFNVLVTHYDLVIRDKAFLRKVWMGGLVHAPVWHDCRPAVFSVWA